MRRLSSRVVVWAFVSSCKSKCFRWLLLSYLLWNFSGITAHHIDRHIFSLSFCWFVIHEVLGRSLVTLINLLDLHYVILDIFKVFICELSVLLKSLALLDVSQYQVRYFFKVEFLVTSERKYLVWVLVMNNDKDLRITSFDKLLSFTE